MPEPITTTAIVTLAATKFIEGMSGELSKRFTHWDWQSSYWLPGFGGKVRRN